MASLIKPSTAFSTGFLAKELQRGCGIARISYCRSSRKQQSYAKAAVAPLQKNYVDEGDYVKAGGQELSFVQMQALKPMDQPKIADKLTAFTDDKVLDLAVIGCGPAGLALASEAARRGLSVVLVGPDMPFTNNYGVWQDEFDALGLESCIEHTWKDTAMYFTDNDCLLLGRAYGRVGRDQLREELLRRCQEANVLYHCSEVEDISRVDKNSGSTLACASGKSIKCRLATFASGAASGKFLKYEALEERGMSVQTAYGIEVEVEKHPYDPNVMVFMDYRDYKAESGDGEVPSFLYVMPFSETRVFFEETCLAARPVMSFNTLKDRLYTRLNKLGVKVVHMYEEEWSYIPVGATLPDTNQQHLAFGAAASMVHPATGYSVVRSLSEAPTYAAAIAAALQPRKASPGYLRLQRDSISAALEAWNVLWPNERKRQRAFFFFGLELLLQLDVQSMRTFFQTFFKLPERMWKGFLAADLSSAELIWFALLTFLVAPNTLRMQLVKHLIKDPSGANLIKFYTQLWP
ncbi:hypothetical protein SELMODRAFT_101391 [Selaginella moellendorffii]|uniref:Lycopene epsilon-cyclase n=1 Tax=Selaginella moellendorffii TaxID=88036 RepID=D8RTT4_SELML|nr:lycopene epsilon cyclase, chloroplastic [Selaginella moellendorffii]EFJ24566.1 hypothetical protein SELMODRAFT_101391 [Selaginella moellendorffii]|eukprot:XP_002974344.1 lycopene epsilon cyclase, chloroplastic [Selaginella moellendorffii]